MPLTKSKYIYVYIYVAKLSLVCMITLYVISVGRRGAGGGEDSWERARGTELWR